MGDIEGIIDIDVSVSVGLKVVEDVTLQRI